MRRNTSEKPDYATTMQEWPSIHSVDVNNVAKAGMNNKELCKGFLCQLKMETRSTDFNFLSMTVQFLSLTVRPFKDGAILKHDGIDPKV